MNDSFSQTNHFVVARHFIGVFLRTSAHTEIDDAVFWPNHFGDSLVFRGRGELDFPEVRGVRFGSAAESHCDDLRDDFISRVVQMNSLRGQFRIRFLIGLQRW